MKNKPQRHKDVNTFKFQPFSERIDNIDVDIFHRVCHEYEVQSEEDGCYFYQTVEKWNVLNLTEGYDSFKKEIKPYRFVTTPQLLQQKDFVLNTLLKHIKYKNPLCLQPLLDILVATAKDLRKEFYPYYKKFLAALIELLNIKDPEIIEWTFTCLAYMFKTLWRILIKDIDSVFKALLPLLSDNKPEYIQNFASESFAFVVRKVKDKQEFLGLIIKAVDNESTVKGCGKLLFEVIHGVNGQFHSHADIMLPFLLSSLRNSDTPTDILKRIVSEIIINISQKIHPSKNELLWISFISILKENNSDGVLNVILELIEQTLTLRNGKLLVNPLPLVQTILSLFSLENLSEQSTFLITKICILLLLSTNVKLPQEQASLIVKKVLAQSDDLILYFVKNVRSFTSFEALVLSTFLKRCVANSLNDKWLHSLTELILEKSPNCESGISLNSWVKYSIDFNSKEHSVIVENVLKKHIVIDDVHDLLKNVTNYLCSVICVPHVNLNNKNEIVEILHKNIQILCPCQNDEHSQNALVFFLLNYTVEALIHMENDLKLLSQHFNLLTEILLPFATDFNCINSLKILDVYLTSLRDNVEIITMENLTKLHDALKYNFTSPYHEMRLLTAHIFTLFEDVPELSTGEEKLNIFSICYNVESTEAHVNTYRDQLNNLEKLGFGKSQMNLCKSTLFNTTPLLYLFGTLYINFQLLWDPVINIIASHAHGLEMDLFWNICLNELKNAIKNSSNNDNKTFDSCNADMDEINNLFVNSSKVKSCPDFVNYRVLLWKTLSFIPEIAEAKTRDVSDLFLDFIESEYRKSHSDAALSWNIKQKETESEESTTNQDEDTILKSSGKANLRLLIQHLTVFSKIKSPKSMYKEQELYKIYSDLLSHKNPEVQKLALSCILTYKNKNLVPYSTNLFNLIDDKNFKNELTLFRIDQESTIVQPEHRNDLIPIVMKIVFSKMFAKTGLRTGGKSYGQLRRNLILRFLVGCHEDELMKFIEMMFKYYSKYLEDDVQTMVKNITINVDLTNFIPPKRLQSTLNLLSIVFEKFGGVIGNGQLSYLLKVLLIIGSNIKGAFDQLPKIHSGYLTVLKNIRVDAIRIVGRFFEHFETYPWTSVEIDAVFDVFVWPYLEKLETEGIHSPTTLLKLFIVWGTNPRYFPLLAKHAINDENYYPLIKVIKLMVCEKTHNSVVNVIMEMIEKLLTLQNNEESEKLKIPIENILPIQKSILDRLSVNDTLNYGSCILLPHVPSVLLKFRHKLSNKSRNITQRDLFILSRISELVWESETSDSLLQLLLPIALKKCNINAGEETIVQLLTTINNLMTNVNDSKKHFKQVCPLFGSVKYCSGRKILCDILTKINKSDFVTVMELNAWDSKWVDQPDFQKRLDAFRGIKRNVEDESLSYELGILIIYNCYYFIQSERDLSLRENSTDCLKVVIPYLLKKYQQHKDNVLNGTVFSLLKQWMRNKNDDIRNEGVLLLGHLARECHSQHTVLRDLNKLTNRDDLEVDFFENLTHLQLHRRARALLKFTKVFKEEQSAPNSRTLTQFILPLTTYYLCNDKYANKNTLVDAAIEVVNTVCRFLPWHQYEALLKFYLAKLRSKAEFQRQLVRLNVAILDAFHFDLRKVNGTDINVEVNSNIDEEVKPEQMNRKNDTNNDDKKGEEIEEKIFRDNVTADNDKSDIDKSVEGVDSEIKNETTDKKIEDQVEEEEEEIDDALEGEEDLSDNDEEEEEEEEEEKVNNTETTPNEIKAYDKIVVLCKSTATRVTKVIQTVLLPQLNKALAEMTHYEASHKVNKKYTKSEREEEDLLRVPISLAVVKLLQKLPKEILDPNLPGVFMKLCTFLKSRLDSVRRVARETLQKIMVSLGPDYLTVLLSEMAPLLNRGYQVHVLVFTIHGVLSSLKESYQPGHIDKVLLTVVDLCKTDLFGTLAEEKEVAKIVTKVSEAKSTKSYDTLQILAQFITEKCLMDLILPIKYVLTNSFSYKIVSRAQESLRFIAMGLTENSYIHLESLLKFTYGVASERISELLPVDKSTLQEKKQKQKIEKPDCFIIPKAPVGVFKKHSVKVSAKTNAHILTEFGLRICNFLLKRDKLSEDEYKPYLDPFVEVFINCLNSRHVKLSTLTLQTLNWVMKYELPSMQKHINKITEMIFSILHKYASAGLSKGDNFDLVIAAFKAMAVLVRDVKYHTINKQQLKLLLLYCEQDLHDHDRQATAFSLIKAIIARKLIAKEIDSVMMKVANLSITSALDHVRVQARTVFYQFIMTYPLGKKLEKYIDFYVSQLDYELQSGRNSAIDMISDFIKSFPINAVREFSGMFLVTLGARLVNDDVPECRIKIAACITSMMSRLEKKDRDALFEIILLWLKDKKISHRRMAAQLCGILVKVETNQFEERLTNLMPTILLQFGLEGSNKPGHCVLLKQENTDEDNSEEDSIKDHHLFQVLNMMLKICDKCPSFFKYVKEVQNLSEHIQTLLNYPHEWVRLASAQFLGFVLSTIDVKHLSDLLISDKCDNEGYLYSDPPNAIKSLTLDLCAQLQPGSVKSELAEQVIKNLVFLARVLEKVPMDNENKEHKINLLWLTKRMRKIVNVEVVEAPSSIVLRTEVFKWIGGIATTVDSDKLQTVLNHLLAPLIREMITTEESNAPLRQLSKEVGKIMKRRVGDEVYTAALSKLQQHLLIKRTERKRARTQLAVTDPEVYAKKKLKHQEKKKESKKRRLEQTKGMPRKSKRRKIVDLELENDEII